VKIEKKLCVKFQRSQELLAGTEEELRLEAEERSSSFCNS
jgi:hypothetical protein